MSNLVVQTNVLALNSHRNLKTVGTKQATSSQRLSSGYRINSAADDAAGLAISEKMRSQIRGLDMASKNAQDAISLIQTAEGGMQEIDNMVQRIRELVVYASTDTMEQATSTDAQGDRQKVQNEINQYLQEIDSMASRVEFNKKKLIDGTYAGGGATMSDSVRKLVDAFNAVGANATAITNLNNARDALATANADAATATKDEAVLTKIQTDYNSATGSSGPLDVKIQIALDEAAAAWNASVAAGGETNDASKLAAITAAFDKHFAGHGLTLSASHLGTSAGGIKMEALRVDNVNTLAKTALSNAGAVNAVNAALDGGSLSSNTVTGPIANYAGVANAISDVRDARTAALNAVGTQSTAIATQLEALNSALSADPELGSKFTSYEEMMDAYNVKGKALWFQLGANTGQGMFLNINGVTTKELFGDSGTHHVDALSPKGQSTNINVMEITGNEDGLGDDATGVTALLKIIDDGLTKVTSERAKLGAAQNRLEFTKSSLDISSENLSASESRIRDADMAKEMMALTAANVLQQAGVSMLAQANQAPQSVLQLLR